MATVYVAQDEKTDERVVVKVLHPNLLTHPEIVERFKREMRATRQIRHPHLVRSIGQSTEEEACRYFVLEFLKGPTLQHFIQQHAPLPESSLLVVALGITRGLRALHKRQLVHRDLKPANVILVEGQIERVKVLDFGLALDTEAVRVTSANIRIGTPSYMAPEYIESNVSHVRSDLYSLGAVLFEMATGRRMFEGTGRAMLLHQLSEERPMLSDHVPGLFSADLERLIRRLVDRDPEQRPLHTEEVERLLVGLKDR
jgi:serine/threonine protein kinase